MDNPDRINNLLSNIFNAVLKMEELALADSSADDLSLNEMHTLEAIGAGSSRSRHKTMSQVAAALKISVSTLTTSVSRLVRKGYVERSRAPHDGRIVRIALTEAGLTAVSEHQRYHRDLISGSLSMLSGEELDLFMRSLEGINEFVSMRKVAAIRDPSGFASHKITIGGIKIPVPVFQGGMGIGVSLGGLAGAVAREGGVGCVAAAECGFAEPDFKYDRESANIRVLKREIKKAVSIAAGGSRVGPIAANIPYTVKNYSAAVTAAVEAGARMIISGAGIPTSLPGIPGTEKAALIPIVSSPRAARLIIKNWTKKHGRLPDAFIFEGPSAGGTLGYKEEKIDIAREDLYSNIVEMKGILYELGSDRPLIVGGGIRDRRDAEKVYAFGADAVQIGTRFVTTEECDASEGFKRAYLYAGEQDIALVTPAGERPCWAVRNGYVRDFEKGADVLPTEEAALAAAAGDLENGLIMCGRDCWKNSSIEKVKDIVGEFA